MTGIDVARLPRPSDLEALTRMTINHSAGVYMLNDEDLEKHQYDGAILLGAVRQRVMFKPRDEGGVSSTPECRSLDFEHGRPTATFPEELSNFPAFAVTEARAGEGEGLACGACNFSQWTHDPAARRATIHPRCQPQIVVPMLLPGVIPSDPYIAAVCSYQRSAEKPITDYMRTFTKANRPAYTSVTRLRLNVNIGSGFKYSTPTFTDVGRVDEGYYPLLSALYRAARGIIKSPPPPPAPRVGGMLSVSTATAAEPRYTGGFFK